MFIRIKQVKGNSYFYLMESQRVEGKPHPVPKSIVYLGNQDAAIARLQAMTIPNQEQLIAQVRVVLQKVIKDRKLPERESVMQRLQKFQQ